MFGLYCNLKKKYRLYKFGYWLNMLCMWCYMSVHSDGRESHIVTKKFEVKQLDTDISSHNDDSMNFSRTVSVNEVGRN